MKYHGYSIEPVKEKSLGAQGDPKGEIITVTSYAVRIGTKVVAAGLPDAEAAKKVVDTRRKVRTRAGLDPEG